MSAIFPELKGRRVLLTGHTGFKGSWLSLWLRNMGATVVGYSLDVPSTPLMEMVRSPALDAGGWPGRCRQAWTRKRQGW